MDYKKKKSNSHSLDKISVDNNNKSESKFAKGIRKITRKSSFSKDKRKSSSDLGHKHKDVDGSIPAVSITVKLKETPILPDKNLPLERDSTGSPPPIGPNLVPLSKASSKSEDSLDSGIYSRQKSCDSMESVGSVSSNTEQPQTTSFVAGGMSPSEDHPPSRINESDYEVYWREVNNIRESIVSQTHSEEDVDVKKPVARTDSGDDEEDSHEADWLRQVGLADLVTSSSSPSNSMSTTGDRNSQISTESLSSMTVLSTLTRPQRAAVLRRITSFNRAQQTKRQPKPHIRAVFPSSDDDGHHDDGNRVETNLDSGKPPIASPPPSVDVTRSTALTDEEIASKTASLPHNLTGFDDVYHRRYSETPRTMSRLNAPDSGLTHSSMQGLGHVMKVGNKSHIKKGDMDSIIAAGNSEGIESLSIRSRSTDDNSRWQSSDASSLHLSDTDKTKVMGYSETADHENLPNFSLVKDRLGITRISDLCDPDVSKVRTLSLIELTALFDLHGIELKRKKFGKTRIKESGTFGVPLTTLLEWDQKRRGDMSLRVPIVLQEIITFLEENGLNDEGILRVPGSAVRIKALKQELEERYSPDGPVKLLDPESGWGNVRTNDVAALLKQFLRELPNPLLTTEYIDAFISCELIPDRKQQLQALNLLILLLNPTHRDALKLLLKFLSRVVAREESNKMSLNNVAMIMAPNLFMGRKSSKREMPSATAANQDVKHAAGTSNIVRMLIKYHKLLWTVPTFMLTQVRNMNQAENSSKKPHSQTKDNKGRLKFLPGMSRNKESTAKKSSPVVMAQPFDYEVPKGVIRVQIQNHVMTSMAIQINAQTTAAEVIAKVTRQCERAKELSPERDIAVITNETHALYEVGGNIHERCLDPGTNMNMLTKVNSDATWVIKKRTAR